MKIIVSAGGTGGHIYPALAIIDKFKKKEKNLEVLYIGTHNRMEKDIVPKRGIKYEALEIYGFSRTEIVRDFKNIGLIYKAYKKCLKIMQEFKPDIVIGVGGYVTYPVIKAANKLKIKTFIHEQNSIPGKSNIALSKKVDLIGVSFEGSKKYFKNAKKVVYTGNPCGEAAINAKKITKESLGLDKNKKLVLVVAGSLGSATLNNTFKEFLKTVDKENYQVLYITGASHYDRFVEGEKYSKNVKVLPYLDNLVGLMHNTDLIVTRAGASTMSEILAIGVPAIFIPSPYVANNHQYYNALEVKNKDAAYMIEEKDLNTRELKKNIDIILNNEANYKKLKTNIKKLGMNNSSEIIYAELKDMIK